MAPSLLGEFLGTAVLIILGDGVVANVVLSRTKGNSGGWVVITAGWAMAVVMGVFTAIAVGAPQADLNPAVTLAKLLKGTYPLTVALQTMMAQVLGAFVGACIVWLHYLPHFAATDDPSGKLAIFCTGPAIKHFPGNLISEIVGTVVLVFMCSAIFAGRVGTLPPGLGPYLVGMLVWAIGLSLGGTTGYAINPARDLGPRLAHAVLPIAGKGDSDWSYAWVPVVGPLAGATLASMLASAVL